MATYCLKCSGMKKDSLCECSAPIDGPRETLRDKFAIAALCTVVNFQPDKDTVEGLAEGCYKIADAMLAERSKTK